MTATGFEHYAIARACWLPFRDETSRGMVFAAMALRNRAAKGFFNGSLYRNAVAELAEAGNEHPDTRDPEFQIFLAALDGIVSGKTEDRTGGAMYWTSLDSEETISGERTAQLGRFVFFK